jgi:hypothetical protein
MIELGAPMLIGRRSIALSAATAFAPNRVGRAARAQCAFGRFFATTELNKLYCQTASFNVAVRLLESLGLVNRRRSVVEARGEPYRRGDAVKAIM